MNLHIKLYYARAHVFAVYTFEHVKNAFLTRLRKIQFSSRDDVLNF